MRWQTSRFITTPSSRPPAPAAARPGTWPAATGRRCPAASSDDPVRRHDLRRVGPADHLDRDRLPGRLQAEAAAVAGGLEIAHVEVDAVRTARPALLPLVPLLGLIHG